MASYIVRISSSAVTGNLWLKSERESVSQPNHCGQYPIYQWCILFTCHALFHFFHDSHSSSTINLYCQRESIASDTVLSKFTLNSYMADMTAASRGGHVMIYCVCDALLKTGSLLKIEADQSLPREGVDLQAER